MKKGLLILTMVGILLVSFLYFRNERDRKTIARGNMIIQQIENFKQKRDTYPIHSMI